MSGAGSRDRLPARPQWRVQHPVSGASARSRPCRPDTHLPAGKRGAPARVSPASVGAPAVCVGSRPAGATLDTACSAPSGRTGSASGDPSGREPTPCMRRANALGSVCRRRPVTGRTRCKRHGGATPRGAESPHFRHGRYSRHVPTAVLARLREASADPAWLTLRQEIALVDARTCELLETLPAGSTAEWMRRLRETWQAFTTAANPADVQALRLALADLVETGARADETWQAICRSIDHRRRLVDAEMRRQVALQQVVTLEQVVTVFEAMRVSVQQHVTDSVAVRAIRSDLGRLLEFSE